MQINTRLIAIVFLSLLSVGLSACKNPAQNTNQQNPGQPTPAQKTGRWVAQWRSPYSTNISGTNLATFAYSSISVVSASVVFVAGDMPSPKIQEERTGVIIRTTDGGRNWIETLVEQPGMRITLLNSIHFVNANLGWVVGLDSTRTGVMLKTTDGGSTWAASKLGFKQAPTTVFFANADTGWMGGSTPPLGEDDGDGGPSDLLGTTDGGQTWQSQRRLPTTINEIFFLDKTTGWAAGYNGAIYQTTDGGRTWNAQRSELEPGDGPMDLTSDAAKQFAINGIHFANSQNGLAAAESIEDDLGYVLATVNGGASWARQLKIADQGVRDVFMLNPTEGWALTKYGHYIYHTVDGGRYWLSEQVQFEQDVPFFRIGIADAGHAWAVGGGAIFFRLPD
jgi:photosystem II stability/assembly factor-like uncharacterized protein